MNKIYIEKPILESLLFEKQVISIKKKSYLLWLDDSNTDWKLN